MSKDYLDEAIEDGMKDPKYAAAFRLREVGIALATARVGLGFSQEAIAERIGVARATILDIENRPEKASLKNVIAYASALGGTLEFLAPIKVKREETSGGRGRPISSQTMVVREKGRNSEPRAE